MTHPPTDVTAFLRTRGFPEEEAARGLRGLLDRFEGFAAGVRTGDGTDLASFRRGLAVRQGLDAALAAGFALDGAEEARLASADARLVAGTEPSARCVLEGPPLDPAAHPWAYRRPARLDPEAAESWKALVP